ncbi:MAG: family N-acetyltransferase [Sphingomonadales bacterium]|nr:family N-acetyltransferase [Sphingomonadales bacterium]
MALTPVPDNEIAAVVTSLEMTTRPLPRPMPDSRLRLARWEAPSSGKYRALFKRVGERWMWFSRMIMPDDALQAIIGDVGIEVYAVVDPAGVEVGMLELDFREGATCEISFLGLIPELNGKGHGRWLMAQAQARAWRVGIGRVWVHTCTLDHPSALNFYRAQGFTAFRRELETFADPRLTGHMPADSAPQIPVLSRR